ncbi:MAG: hypothetical protein WD178_08165, partial [Actinomycetota bacterium]
LQCSYFNFHHLHYVRIAGAASTSRLDEREIEPADPATRVMASVYQVWFGWQDRLIARIDLAQRRSLGFPETAEDPRCEPWFGARPFMVANSALCFGTHTFVLVIALLAGRPEWFLPSVVVGMTAYWALIVLARRVVFRRSGVGATA